MSVWMVCSVFFRRAWIKLIPDFPPCFHWSRAAAEVLGAMRVQRWWRAVTEEPETPIEERLLLE